MRHTILFSLFVLLVGCRSENNAVNDESAALAKVQLQCETLEEVDGVPRSAVYALLNDSKIKLAELTICETILPADYADKGIPADALTAVGGWWAGLGDYVYARLESGQLQLFIGGIGEGEEGVEPVAQYAPLATYQKGQFQLLRPLHLADLAGYYMHQSADTSYVLFLGLKGPALISKVFATGEPMPAQKVLQRALPEFATGPETDFMCDLNSLNFVSEAGYGHVYWSPDSAALTFYQFLGKPDTVVFELLTY